MITLENLGLQFGGQVLYQHADLQFVRGNCYGIIGANGAGKSTLLRIISGEIEPTSGAVYIDPKCRMSVLKQNQELYDEYSILETVKLGNPKLVETEKEKNAIYEKEDFTDEDGLRAAELEELFAEMGGWEADSDAARLLQGLGIPAEEHYNLMKDTDPRKKVKVLLCQALFGNPDIILLDEPTNNLDLHSVVWLEDFLADYDGTVLVVSHDRYFLNNVCTHIVDIDYGKIKMYVGNYDFWYESSQLIQKLIKDQNKKAQQKIEELQNFIQRFSANKSKSRQATSRRKLLDKLTVEELPASSRRYPWVGFKAEREPGKDRLFVDNLSYTRNGKKLINNVSFVMGREDKIAVIGQDEIAVSAFFDLLAGVIEPDEGTIKWGVSTTQSYFPKDHDEIFNIEDNLIDWLRQFSEDKRESYMRTFLGRMLFSGDEVYKSVSVLSGGEKVRCLLSKMMLEGSSVLLLDQPTNHLDLESVQALNNGLTAFPFNVILTSHDHQLIQTVCNRIIEITPDGIIDRNVSFDEYMHIDSAEE
ncbi:MAG: ATP-binding cassette domain-containing protein [Oscillospiraceae bacterium]|nr:ATP-binding cassette domain-containing protein [Oscillospiraceae bacterium]